MKDYSDVIQNRYNAMSYQADKYGSNMYAVCNPIGYYSFIHTMKVLVRFVNLVHNGKKSGKMKLLDIGCGGGAATRIMWEIVGGIYGDVYGLDGSETRIRHCREMNPSIDYLIHNIVDVFPYDFKFDGITAFVVLMHLRQENDVIRALKNIYDALSDNGLFMWCDNNVDTHFSHFNDDGRGFSAKEMDYYAQKTGFVLVEATSMYRQFLLGKGSTLYNVNESNVLKMLVLDKILKTKAVTNVRIYRKSFT